MGGLRSNELNDSGPEIGQLRGHFTLRARQRVEAFLNSMASIKPTLALLYSNSGGTQPGTWSMQAVSDAIVQEHAHMHAGFGAVVLYELDGIRVLVPQLNHIAELDQGVLDFQGDRLVATLAAPE